MNRPAVALVGALLGALVALLTVPAGADPTPVADVSSYPWHTGIPSTTFWVGEIADPGAADGSQRISAYDPDWLAHYGGCDGVVVDGTCATEPRSEGNGWFPTAMTPRQNPFYLDLPFDDVNDPTGRRTRATVVPWAGTPPWSDRVRDPSTSIMKDRWVELRRGDRVCFGQIEDAGPARYDDARYVFGTRDERPANTRFGGAGLDVSPALNGCLGFTELDGSSDRVDWRFVDDAAVPPGPWTRIVTGRTP